MQLDNKALKEMRQSRLLTQKDLADQAGISVGTLLRIENGHQKPRFSTIKRLAVALGVDPVAEGWG